MPVEPPNIAMRITRFLPESIRSRFASGGLNRLIRFAPAAVFALASTQLTYLVCYGLLHVTAGISAVAGWLAGVIVSYGVSRWAWERKGRPDLLRETLPFAMISICVGIVLTLTSKFANHEVVAMGLTGLKRIAFAQGMFLAANCVTFLTRFFLFHRFIFADRAVTGPVVAESITAVPVPADQD